MFGTKFSLLVAGAATMLTAGAAQANEKPVAIATTAATSAAAAADTVNLNQRYCILSDVTGSRIQRKECAPLGQWKDRGIDPTKMHRR